MRKLTDESDPPLRGSAEEWSSLMPVSDGFGLGRLAEAWFEDVGKIVRDQISPGTAAPDELLRVQRINPDSFWGLFAREECAATKLAGFYGQLLLNEAGTRALIDRSLNRMSPQLEYLARDGERPAAVYIWCVVAKRKAALLQAALMQQLQQRQSGMPYFAALATADSLKIGRQLGFQPLTADDDRLGGLFRLPSILPTLRTAALASRVKVVETPAEFHHAKVIRAACFVGEQACPVDEEFDGNDFSAQHLIGYVGDQPAAAMRIRYFAAFAKWERYCVLPRFRRTRVKDDVIAFAVELVKKKGFREIYFHAEPKLQTFWEKRGFEKSVRNRQIGFSDRSYLEFSLSVPADGEALTLHSDPMTLNRVEGAWARAGILEKSIARGSAGNA